MLLVENCEKIEINSLLKIAKSKLKQALLQSEIEAQGLKIRLATSRTGLGGNERFWFSCPSCEKRCGILFKHPLSGMIACRNCTGLGYRKCFEKGASVSE